MVDRDDPLPIVRQRGLLDVVRSTVYYRRQGVSTEGLELIRLIDEAHLKHPYYGSRRIRDRLEDRGERVNRKRVQRLMRQMGLVALYPKRNLSRRNQVHQGLSLPAIDAANQVWAADVTYILMAKGFAYLVAVNDWYSRKVLSWRLSNTLDADFCVEALQEALDRYGQPAIFNTDRAASSPARSLPRC